jgi:hypothetical protein
MAGSQSSIELRRDLQADLVTCEAGHRGPVAWQKFGARYHLTGQYGKRPIIISTVYDRSRREHVLSTRDPQTDLLQPLTPEHPDARRIAESWDGWPHAIKRAIGAEDLLTQLLAIKHDDPLAALSDFADLQEAAAQLLGIKYPGEGAPQ